MKNLETTPDNNADSHSLDNDLLILDLRSEIQKEVFRKKVAEIYGPSWIDELLSKAVKIAKTVPDSVNWGKLFKIWDLVEHRVTPKNLPELAELISTETITGDNNSFLKGAIFEYIDKISASNDCPEVTATTQRNLEKGFDVWMDLVRNMNDIHGETLASDFRSLFDYAKILLRTDSQAKTFLRLRLDDLSTVPLHLARQIDKMITMATEENWELLKNTEYIPSGKPITSAHLAYNTLEEEVREIVSDTDAIEIAVRLYHQDHEYILNELSKMLDGGGKEKVKIEYRIILSLPEDSSVQIPLLMMRPADVKKPSDQYLKRGVRLDHEDIYITWLNEARTDPKSDRAKLFWYVLRRVGGFRDLSHLDMITAISENGIENRIASGWRGFEETSGTTDEVKRALTKYNVNTIQLNLHSNELINIDKMVLDFEMNDLIEQYSERLAVIVPQNRVKQFRELAKKFMKDPNADQSSLQFQIYKELFQLATKVGSGMVPKDKLKRKHNK